MNWTRSAAVTASLVLSCASLPALAALGGSADSVRSDAAALRSAMASRAVSQPAFTVQTLTLNNGTAIDEYISATGTVFALHWSGPRPPDLKQLLGDYYAGFQAASSLPHRRQGGVRLDTGRMRYSTGGHMGALWGTAYAPSLLPEGLKLEDLQ